MRLNRPCRAVLEKAWPILREAEGDFADADHAKPTPNEGKRLADLRASLGQFLGAGCNGIIRFLNMNKIVGDPVIHEKSDLYQFIQ